MTPHDSLPIPDYDHLPLGGLISRIRTLDVAGLETLLSHERAHANRAPVTTAMANRLTALREGAEPSGGDPAADVASGTPESAAGGSKVSEATAGPPVNPPSQGVPTNPAQPR